MIKEKDFIEIEYTGKLKDDNLVFDTTDKKVAEENDIPLENPGPVTICVGEGQVLKGVDKNMIGKEPGKEYSFSIQPEDAFGKKSAKLIKLIPTAKFKQNEVFPQPGLQVNIDNRLGTVKTVTGGRTLVDFNHPLSGRVLEYHVKILRKIEDDQEKLKGFLKFTLGISDPKIENKDGDFKVLLADKIPKELSQEVLKKLKEIIPSIKNIEFAKEEAKAKTQPEKTTTPE